MEDDRFVPIKPEGRLRTAYRTFWFGACIVMSIVVVVVAFIKIIFRRLK